MAPRVCPAVCEHHPWCRVDCLVHDIGGNAPRCAGRELGTTQVGLARGISRGFFSPEFGQSAVFDLGSGSKREREERTPDERSRCVDRRHRSGSVRATGYKQRQRLPPLGQPPTRFRCRLNRRHSEADRGGPGDRSSVVAKDLPIPGENSATAIPSRLPTGLTSGRAHDTVKEGGQEMEHEPRNVVLSPHGAEMLRAAHNRHPEMSTAEILERALSERFGRALESTAPRIRTGEEIRAWLDELAALSDRIPAKPGETFSREMIYQEHA